MCRILRDRGYAITEELMQRALAGVVHDYDESLANGRRHWDAKSFFEDALQRAGVKAAHLSGLAALLEGIDAEKSLWSTTSAWVSDALAKLKARGYRMSVISNADGRVAQSFAELGLDSHFQAIFDSGLVGYAKPDARLFQHAISELGQHPRQCIYIGDMYHVDVLGANRAGVAAVQVDPYGLYAGWPGLRISTVASLPGFLSRLVDWQEPAFFPLREGS
jgi:putative hydrolase of the HAD superfamily